MSIQFQKIVKNHDENFEIYYCAGSYTIQVCIVDDGEKVGVSLIRANSDDEYAPEIISTSSVGSYSAGAVECIPRMSSAFGHATTIDEHKLMVDRIAEAAEIAKEMSSYDFFADYLDFLTDDKSFNDSYSKFTYESRVEVSHTPLRVLKYDFNSRSIARNAVANAVENIESAMLYASQDNFNIEGCEVVTSNAPQCLDVESTQFTLAFDSTRTLEDEDVARLHDMIQRVVVDRFERWAVDLSDEMGIQMGIRFDVREVNVETPVLRRLEV